MLRRVLREPLVHFLVLGALLFAVAERRGGRGAGSNRIIITPGQVDAMVAAFGRTWQRPPTEQELKGLVDDYVREEMATREAAAAGLDRDDTIIRRRLRQKLEFVVEDSVDASPITNADLQRWLDEHPDRFTLEPAVAFRQIYFSPERRGDAVETDARRLLATLSAAGVAAGSAMGDTIMLPEEIELSDQQAIARQFGDAFADSVLKLAPGRWQGPIDSGYGVHLVWVHERTAGRAPDLSAIRPLVEREVQSERRRQQLDRMYDELLTRYRVVVEKRSAATSTADTARSATGATP